MLQLFINITSSVTPTITTSRIHARLPNPVNINSTKTAKMQFIILAFAALAAATPARLRAKRAPIDVCPAIDTPQCCQADVDGVLALTCSPRKSQLSRSQRADVSQRSLNLTTF